MMTAKQHRENAWAALKGRWGIAVLACLITGLLSGGLSGISEIGSVGEEMGLAQMETLGRFMWLSVSVSSVIGIGLFIISGAVELGYAGFQLRLIDREPVRIGMLFDHFNSIGKGLGMLLLRALYVFLWMLPGLVIYAVIGALVGIMAYAGDSEAALAGSLVSLWVAMFAMIIPGIIAAYRYLLTGYIIAENPQIKVKDALRRSAELMKGNKWRAFCLNLSFIGWFLLGMLTFGIAMLWVSPYVSAAQASFYRELSGSKPQLEAAPYQGPEL